MVFLCLEESSISNRVETFLIPNQLVIYLKNCSSLSTIEFGHWINGIIHFVPLFYAWDSFFTVMKSWMCRLDVIVFIFFSSGKLQSIWNMQTHSVFCNGIPVTCIPFSLTWQFFEKINLSSCWMSFSLATKGLHKIFWTFLLSLPTDIHTHT